MHRKLIRSVSPVLVTLAIVCSSGSPASAADPARATVQKVLTGLSNPRGVAVRPDGAGDQYEVFVAESGAGRVVKCNSGNSGKSTDAITGFARPSSAGKSLEAAGVQSLQFLDHTRLVVIGADEDGKPFVGLYELAESDSAIPADQPKQSADLPMGEKEPRAGFPSLLSVARTQPNDRVGDVLIVPAWADRKPPGLVVIPLRAGALADPVSVRLNGGRNDLEVGGIAVAKSGYVVVAGRSAASSDRLSLMEFMNPLDRRVVMQVPIELERIVALAYSPKTGNLYAANYPASDDGRAGVYRIDAAGGSASPVCKAVKIADVRRPTALACTPDGALYVTDLGDSTGTKTDDGSLLKLTGEL